MKKISTFFFCSYLEIEISRIQLNRDFIVENPYFVIPMIILFYAGIRKYNILVEPVVAGLADICYCYFVEV